MLASITPLGEQRRQHRWAFTVAFYLLGSLVGGALLGGVAGLAGWVLRLEGHPAASVVLAAIAAAALAALVIDARWPGAIPYLRRQVNEDWLGRYRSWVYGAGFGVQLGAAVVTVVTTSATYLMVVIALLSPRAWWAISVGATYGLARALPVLLTARVDTFPRLSDLHRRVTALQGAARRLTVGTELVVAAVAAGAAWGVR